MLTNKSLSLAHTRCRPYPHARIAAASRKLAPIGEALCLSDGVVKRRLRTEWDHVGPDQALVTYILAECPFVERAWRGELHLLSTTTSYL